MKSPFAARNSTLLTATDLQAQGSVLCRFFQGLDCIIGDAHVGATLEACIAATKTTPRPVGLEEINAQLPADS
jgi:hypothetical protein